jgi:hypothetical protein
MNIKKSFIFWRGIIIHILDSIYAEYIKKRDITGEYGEKLTEETFDEIKRIHDLVYPEGFDRYDKFNSIEEFCDEQCCQPWQIVCYKKGNYYMLLVNRINGIEIIDLAGYGDNPSALYFIVKEGIADNHKRSANMMAREETSYRIVKMLEKQHKVKIIKDKTWNKKCGTMHLLKIVEAPNKKGQIWKKSR